VPAKALFCLNAYCGTVFAVCDKRGVHLVGEPCPVYLLKVNSGAKGLILALDGGGCLC
jgi:hypothetical protein